MSLAEGQMSRQKKDEPTLHGLKLRNFWRTPWTVFNAIENDHGDFHLDAASLPSDTRCCTWLGFDHPDPGCRDALNGEDWFALYLRACRVTVPYDPNPTRMTPMGIGIWLNPPFGADAGGLDRWVQRAWQQSRVPGVARVQIGRAHV